MPISRRDFLRYSSSLTATLSLSTALSGCTLRGQLEALSSARFAHGVASGDPSADGMVLWTRAEPKNGREPLTVGWELALDERFTTPLRSGVATTSAATDFTVKIDVRELDPGTAYYYRFRAATEFSGVGRTRTLPVGAVESLRLAVFSCSNYPAGYFHAYDVASRLPDVDVFLHLGDYFYEYGAGGYATERAAELGREFPSDNAGELYSLTDYRRRYALYRSDRDLQAMHAAAPMIAVWDDHEIANDTWTDGAQNHGPDEGDFATRKAAAVQAYFEWLPLRPLTPDAEGRIYRSFTFGDLVDLHMLDTRLIGRDQQLEYGAYVDADSGAMDAAGLGRDLAAPDRSLLGPAQRSWLNDRLADSQARWQVLG
ncbi:MAG: alkaline phosphatase D family protein, partial [Pseudomonadota bacterium]